MKKIINCFQTIYGLIIAIIMLMGLLWGGFVYINDANIAHVKALKTDELTIIVNGLDIQLSGLTVQVDVLKNLIQRIEEIREFESLKMRKIDLLTWERSRYCVLYAKLMAGGSCDLR